MAERAAVAGCANRESASRQALNGVRAVIFGRQMRASREYYGSDPISLRVRVVRRANQCTDRRMLEAHRVRLAVEHRENVRMHVAQHRQMAGRRLQVLAD